MTNKILIIAIVISVIISVIKMIVHSTYKTLKETGILVPAFENRTISKKVLGIDYYEIEYKYVLNGKSYYTNKLKYNDDVTLNNKVEMVKYHLDNPKLGELVSELDEKIKVALKDVKVYVSLTFLLIVIYAYLIF